MPRPRGIPKFKIERNRITYSGKILALFRETIEKEVRKQRTRNWLKK